METNWYVTNPQFFDLMTNVFEPLTKISLVPTCIANKKRVHFSRGTQQSGMHWNVTISTKCRARLTLRPEQQYTAFMHCSTLPSHGGTRL